MEAPKKDQNGDKSHGREGKTDRVRSTLTNLEHLFARFVLTSSVNLWVDILHSVQKKNCLLVCILRILRITGILLYMHNTKP